MLLTFRIGHDDGVLFHTLRATLYTGGSWYMAVTVSSAAYLHTHNPAYVPASGLFASRPPASACIFISILRCPSAQVPIPVQ